MNDVEKILNENLPEERQCLWQIVPKELPGDLRPMALELWQSTEGLHLMQFFVEDRNARDWYHHVEGFVRFDQAKPQGSQ